MAVLEAVKLQDEGPLYAANSTRTYYQTWNVRTDVEESWQTVAQAIGIVQYQTAYYRDQFALATEMDAKQDEDDENYWIIRYTYTTKIDELAQASLAGGGGGGLSNGTGHNPDEPLTWAPRVKWSTKMYRRVRWRDQDGNMYKTDAGEMMELPMKEYPRLTLSIQRNVPYFNVNLLNRVPYGVNMEPCMGYEARRIYCERLTAVPRFDKQHYWELDAELIIGSADDVNPLIWDANIPADAWWYDKRLHAGYCYKEMENGEFVLKNIIEPSGQRPSRPRPLRVGATRTVDESAVLNLAVPADLAAINFKYFREKVDADFNATGLFNP